MTEREWDPKKRENKPYFIKKKCHFWDWHLVQLLGFHGSVWIPLQGTWARALVLLLIEAASNVPLSLPSTEKTQTELPNPGPTMAVVGSGGGRQLRSVCLSVSLCLSLSPSSSLLSNESTVLNSLLCSSTFTLRVMSERKTHLSSHLH